MACNEGRRLPIRRSFLGHLSNLIRVEMPTHELYNYRVLQLRSHHLGQLCSGRICARQVAMRIVAVLGTFRESMI